MLNPMRSPRHLSILVATVVVSVLVIAVPAYAQTFPIEDGLAPITGISWSPETEQLFVVSDQDELGEVRVFSGSGQPAGSITFDDELISVQSVAAYGSDVFVGDTGDPDLERASVTVFQVPAETGQQDAVRYEFAYPDGPQDAAAMAVSQIGRLWFITAGEDPGIYRAELSPSTGVTNQLTRMTDAPDGVTDAAFIADSTMMVLRTASGVQLYDAVAMQVTDETAYIGARDGESITGYADEQMLVGDAEQLRIEPLPAGFSTVTPEPLPSPTPSEEPTPTESAATQEPTGGAETPSEDQADTEPQVTRRGTIRALVGAGVLAVVAGGVAFFSRGRRAS